MTIPIKRKISILLIVAFVSVSIVFLWPNRRVENTSFAQGSPSPTPEIMLFDQAAALADLREQIKGKGKDPASVVFKNIQIPFLKNVPAGQFLAIMEMGYARSLGVSCVHCHVPGKWESDDKPQKQITRDMAAMVAKINGDLLKNIKNLGSSPTVNCTTCHRGQIIPATNLPQPPKS